MKVQMTVQPRQPVDMKISLRDPVRMVIRPAEPIAMKLKETAVIYYVIGTDDMDYLVTDNNDYILV